MTVEYAGGIAISDSSNVYVWSDVEDWRKGMAPEYKMKAYIPRTAADLQDLIDKLQAGELDND
jgi:hypothetical protein